MQRTPTVVAMGGGGFSMEPDNPRLDRWLLSLPGTPCPRICFVPTASGDADGYIERFYAAMQAHDCVPDHLALFRRSRVDLRAQLLAQDLIYVGGGNTANLLAIWRLHGVDVVLREAWAQGVVLCGLSAGSLCWYTAGVTDSFGADLAPLLDGLGILPGSHCPHYDGEPQRRPAYRALVDAGVLPPGIAADDGVALRYAGERLCEVVSSRPGAQAWAVAPGTETPLPARLLPL